MAVKMRLVRMGKRKRPFYRIIVCDSRTPRRGRYVDLIGTYDPLQEPSRINLDHGKARTWLQKGVQPTDAVKRLLKVTGFYSQSAQATDNARSEVSEPTL